MPGTENYSAKVKRIALAHGAGGRMSRDLITQLILKHLKHPALRLLEDSALFDVDKGTLALTTDSYVIHPLFFPGGDIGKLAVAGTVNDLLCVGARPLFLSLSLIIEEGLAIEDLDRALASASREAARAGVDIICGDTKVVERGKGDGLFTNTAGVGLVPPGVSISPRQIQPGDVILISGTLGDHGISILCQREGFSFVSPLKSDCAALVSLVERALRIPAAVHCLRDPTRGGLGAVLAEIASDTNLGLEIDQSKIPLREAVRGACELLGLDPLYVANEGKMVLFVARDMAAEVLSAVQGDPLGHDAAHIGEVVSEHPGLAVLRTTIGGSRIIDLPAGELLPRIC